MAAKRRRETRNITFVDEEEDLIEEKIGKWSGRKGSGWSWLVRYEGVNSSDGQDNENTSGESDIVGSECTEDSQSQSQSSCDSSVQFETSDEEEDDNSTSEASEKEEGKTPSGEKKKKPTVRKRAPKVKTASQRKSCSSLTSDEIDEFCVAFENQRESLLNCTKERLDAAGDIKLFSSRTVLKNQIISCDLEMTELVDEMCESFIGVVHDAFSKNLSKIEKQAYFSYSWLKQMPVFLEKPQWKEHFGVLSTDKSDDTSIVACIAEAIFDFAHEHSRKMAGVCEIISLTNKDLSMEDDIILNRFAGASLCRMIKVRKNTIAGKKGTMKIKDTSRQKMEEELKLLKDIKRDSLEGLPKELTEHLNEGGLTFMKDGMIPFIRYADNDISSFSS